MQKDPLWSSRLLHTNPQMIKDIYLSYLRAGADIIITASYKVCGGAEDSVYNELVCEGAVCWYVGTMCWCVRVQCANWCGVLER